MASPKVQITRLLTEVLAKSGFDAGELCADFASWKAKGAQGEYSDWFFGKDGFYDKPKRNNTRVLRHVHLPPEDDSHEAQRWDKSFARKSRRVSNTVLVYAEDKLYGFLLIYIAREPTGHAIAEMKTPESVKLMNQFCDVAEAFIFNGEILI